MTESQTLSPLVDPDDTITFWFWAFPVEAEGCWRTAPASQSRPSKGALRLEFIFKRPSAKDVNTMRRKSTSFDSEHGMFLTDPDKYQEERMRTLLREWNLNEHFGENVKIDSVRGEVVDKSMKIIYQLDPNIMNMIIQELELRMGR